MPFPYKSKKRGEVWNFGENVRFKPAEIYRPANEDELLQILARSRGRKIRVMGRLHSWSAAVETPDVLLDLRDFDSVEVIEQAGAKFARVGAGTQVKRIVSELRRLGDRTLPSLGLIDEQSIAGAIATGTHGSGRNSLSHYVRAMRVVQFDGEGKPYVRTIDSGEELLAARCSLGCMGIVVSVDLEIRPQYLIEEHFRQHKTLDEVIACEQEYPLQQFYQIPWKWNFIGQHRREVTGPEASKRYSRLFGWYFHLIFDIGMHLIILSALICRFRSLIKFLFRNIIPLFVIRNWRVIDRSERILTMQHEMFRHIEIEMFVRRSHLEGMLEWVQKLLQIASGEQDIDTSRFDEQLGVAGFQGEVDSLQGKYTHHYPICIRKVLPDETLISMTAGWDEPGYAVSLICYLHPHARDGFFQFARLLARSSIRMFGARAHWGKFNDIVADELLENYGNWARFAEQVGKADPTGVFHNDWAENLLGKKDPGE